MSPNNESTPKNRSDYAFNLALAAVAGQVGCLTLLVVLAALFGGLWLDNYFNSKPMFTVGLTIASIPVTLVAMFWVVRKATARLNSASGQKNKHLEEETNSGRNT